VIAGSGTRRCELYAPGDDLLPRSDAAGAGATNVGRPAGAEDGADAFGASRARFEEIVAWLGGERAAGMEHGELEARLQADGRELLRALLQDRLDLDAQREQRAADVTDAAGVAHRAVEPGHERPLASVFGPVTVTRLAYRARGAENLHVADGVLNLPVERASHGVRRLAAVEATRGSFDDALAAVREQTALGIGKRQIEQLAARAAIDFDGFYAQRARAPASGDGDGDGDGDGEVIVLSADGKGIVVRPDALRPATAKAAQRASPKLKTRLSKGEKRNRKRLAEVGAVYEITPAARTPADVLASGSQAPTAAPKANRKWLTASVQRDAAAVIGDIFDEAERRDPGHERAWIALVDGNNHQIDRIKTEAKTLGVSVTIIIDLIHVLEYLWSAAWCFYKEADPAAEQWVHDKATAILEGRSGIVAAAIRRKATRLGLEKAARERADRCADYLHNKRPYLDYPTALANGWPIATGIIEGACRHLIKDRMDITGARWSIDGAEAVLKLRALRSNGDFNDYWRYHLTQERRRNHNSRYADGIVPKAA